MTVLLIAAAAGILIAAGALRIVENRIIFFPPRYPEGFPSPQVIQQKVEDIWLVTHDGVKINAFYHSNPASHQVILCFHGNAENIGYGFEHLGEMFALGTNLLAVDYRGYGKSEGKPEEAGVYLDADAAYDYLTQKRNFRPQDIIVYGHSLGGAVAVNLASRRPCAGLIVESSFTSARDMARRMFSIPLIAYVVKSRFDSEELIRKVHAPILIVHGARDETVPYEMGEQLYQAAPEPKKFYRVEGAGHNDVMEVGGRDYMACLKSFVEYSGRP